MIGLDRRQLLQLDRQPIEFPRRRVDESVYELDDASKTVIAQRTKRGIFAATLA